MKQLKHQKRKSNNIYELKPNMWQPPEKQRQKIIKSFTATRTLKLLVLPSGL